MPADANEFIDDFAQRNPMLNRWLNANLQNPPSVMPWSYGLKGCSCTSPYTFQRLVTCLWPNGGADYLSCSDGNDSWIGSARLSALFGLSAIVHRRKFRHSGRPIPGQHSTDMAHDLMDFAEWRLENERCHKMREAAPIHSDAKRIYVGNWQAKNDRDNWCFQPVADKSTPSAGEPASTAHGAEVTSYLATRAISFVLVAFRPLTGAELLAAVSTSFSTDGNNTPPGSPTPVVSLQLIFEVCQGHLYLDRDEVVRLREERRAQLLEQGCGMSYQEAHAMMALTCLTQMKRQPRLILKPWMDFHRFAQPANNFPFHKYLVVFWQRHYALAEKFLARIPEELHALLQNAWIGERAADEPGNDGTDTEVDCLDTWVHVEALDVGLELSKAYGFRELERTYKRLGANTARSLEEYNPRAPCATGSSNTEVNTAIGKRAVIGTHDQAQANNGNYELYQNFSDLSIADTCSGQKKATWRREEAAELAGEPWQLIESAESLTSDMEEL